jgi:hypothetical protein
MVKSQSENFPALMRALRDGEALKADGERKLKTRKALQPQSSQTKERIKSNENQSAPLVEHESCFRQLSALRLLSAFSCNRFPLLPASISSRRTQALEHLKEF